MRLHRSVLVVSFVLGLLSTLFACTTKEQQFLSIEEANLRVGAAYAAKDFECGVSHAFTVPVPAPASESDVNTCAAEIAATSCTAWAAENPAPVTCLAMLIRLD